MWCCESDTDDEEPIYIWSAPDELLEQPNVISEKNATGSASANQLQGAKYDTFP